MFQYRSPGPPVLLPELPHHGSGPSCSWPPSSSHPPGRKNKLSQPGPRVDWLGWRPEINQTISGTSGNYNLIITRSMSFVQEEGRRRMS